MTLKPCSRQIAQCGRGAIVYDNMVDSRRIAQEILDSRNDILFLVVGGNNGQYLQFISHGIVDFAMS